MKKTTLKSIIMLCFIAIALFSCINDDDISTPNVDIENPDIEPNVELPFIEGLYEGEIIEFDKVQNGGELITSGFIISSDATDNINNQIFIQDKAEDPESGLAIDIAVDNIYITHGIGREVILKLNGLGMQKTDNVLHIGTFENGSITPISSENFNDFVIRTNTKTTIVPKMVTINDIMTAATSGNSEDALPNVLVTLEELQIVNDELNTSFANVNNNDDVLKTLIECSNNGTILLQNSGLSKFKALPFPAGKGSITAILTKDILTIRSPEDIDFSEERCSEEKTTLLNEDFESITVTDENIALTGWENINISDPAVFIKWLGNGSETNKYAEIEKGGSSDQYDAWLITKDIQIVNSRNLIVSLDINVSDRNSDNLEIFIVDSVTETTINFNTDNELDIVPQEETTGFTTLETTITIPDGQDNFRIGFKYKKRSDVPATTEYQIDNILIVEN